MFQALLPFCFSLRQARYYALANIAISMLVCVQKPFQFCEFPWQGVALDLSSRYHNICQLGSASVEGNKPILPLDDDPEAMMMMMMRGMTAKNFDPVRYSGRWFEVASLKRGFAGQGQEDCHCTQVLLKWLILCKV